MPEVSVLKVSLGNENVGTLTWLGGEKSVFSFTEDYINNADRSVLSLSFKDIHGDLITDHRPYKMKLMPFFSNLLPEGHLRRYLARTVDIHPDREFFLMWVLGRDLPGAVRIEPAEGDAWPLLPPAPDQQAPDYGDVLRFSLAGVQLKFSAVGDKAGGLTIPAHGVGGDHIVKLPSAEYRGVPENEYSMMALARQVGIDVPAIGLVDVDQIANLPAGIERLGDKAFTIERFDRAADGERVHIEDFAQIFGVFAEDKYKRASAANIARVIAAETEGADIAEFIRRLTFNTLIGNGDMHLKNWSLIYPDGKRARLAPAYDFVSTIPYIPGDRSALNFSRSKDFADYTVDELEHLAAKASLPRRLVLDAAQETVELFFQAWRSTKADLPMSKDVAETIDAHLETLPIAEGR
ncbi:type II toxin-antitoxin system HipA family toxin [Falsigemmobacter faecalis]|uniref:Type II toxin-antitoxin system HipA family toxin n=1 Tax=Falsigemmobacter faecalis TaxID=2488730 RepID=A0A3P3DCM8_9RHOB|nr:HipA domain-containing protein [Falsigemmobacter faecalis]RRH72079.1 type II toxin-antitoxin system HipA family toxin [Falsigemmobacter faecalis]